MISKEVRDVAFFASVLCWVMREIKMLFFDQEMKGDYENPLKNLRKKRFAHSAETALKCQAYKELAKDQLISLSKALAGVLCIDTL